MEIGEDHGFETICRTPGDRAVRGESGKRNLFWCAASLGLRSFVITAPAAGCACRKQIGIEREQPRRGQVLARFHVVDAADHQVFGAGIDIEQRGLRGDFAQTAEALAVDRIDRRLGQAQLERLANKRGVGLAGRGEYSFVNCPPECAMTYLTTREDTQLYVKQWGAGRPVILLHGWPLSSDMWDHHAMKLAEAGYRTIAYDRRGFGRSSQPWTGYDYDTLADDLASVIEQTGARDAVLVGFSMGGGEVARYMSRHAGKGVTQAALVARYAGDVAA